MVGLARDRDRQGSNKWWRTVKKGYQDWLTNSLFVVINWLCTIAHEEDMDGQWTMNESEWQILRNILFRRSTMFEEASSVLNFIWKGQGNKCTAIRSLEYFAARLDALALAWNWEMAAPLVDVEPPKCFQFNPSSRIHSIQTNPIFQHMIIQLPNILSRTCLF
jgi:hypothetical protein